MPKYGRGLNREILGAVNLGLLSEPFGVSDIKHFANKRGWNVPETYLNVSLANGTSGKHSLTYRKYFVSVGNGRYKLGPSFKGGAWT